MLLTPEIARYDPFDYAAEDEVLARLWAGNWPA